MKRQNTQPKYPAFEAWLKANDVQFATEYEFAEALGRKWRTDYYFEKGSVKLAVEVEGGAFTGGRHTRGVGFLGDMEKYNFYTFHRIAVLRFTPDQVTKTPQLVAQAVSAFLQGVKTTQSLEALNPAFDFCKWLLNNGWNIESEEKYKKQFGADSVIAFVLGGRVVLKNAAGQQIGKINQVPKKASRAAKICGAGVLGEYFVLRNWLAKAGFDTKRHQLCLESRKEQVGREEIFLKVREKKTFALVAAKQMTKPCAEAAKRFFSISKPKQTVIQK